MGLKNRIKKLAEMTVDKYRHNAKLKNEIRKFNDPRRVSIYSRIELTPLQMQQIDDVYIKHYGRRIPYTWHRHYTAFTGNFDPLYFPELLYIPEFEHYLNSKKDYIRVIADKNILSMIANGVGIKTPKTIISCANGILRDDNYHMIQWSQVESTIGDETYFAKPTVDSDSGKGCILINKSDGHLADSLKGLGKDFVVQERIKCSNSIRKVYPDSVNTFRLITYIWNGKVNCAPIIMRIGRNGSFLDNAHAGGIFIAVDNDGTLHRKAFTEFKDEFDAHPDTGLVFEGHRIENVPKVIESAIKMHSAIPQLGVVNWDFTINEDEDPVLIEANTSGGSIWLIQMAWGCGVFKENTISILEWLKCRNAK